MDLKLNVSKKGLSTTEEVITEEYTLRYGHIFRGERGKSAYESAVDGGYKGTEEEFNALFKDLNNKVTPSGDPMHYVYESIGAKWNDATGYWKFYDMKDVTSTEMARALARGSWYIGTSAISALEATKEEALSAIRFNIARAGGYSLYNVDMDYMAQHNRWIEFINLTADNTMSSDDSQTRAVYFEGSFQYCKKLRKIYGVINVSDAKNEFTNTFKECEMLEGVEIYGLNKNISFADSPLLSKESLLFMINNCASNATFTITLHPDVYAKCQEESGGEWGGEIASAIDNADVNKHTTVILAK